MTGGAGEWGTTELRNRYVKDTPGQSIVGFKRYLEMDDNIEERFVPGKDAFFDAALKAMDEYVRNYKDRFSLESIAFNILRQYDLGISSRQLVRLYKDKYKINEDAPSMSTSAVAGAGDDSSTVVVRRRKKREFDVPHHIFTRFKDKRKMKYERWSKLLDDGKLYEDKILEYIRNNRNHDIVLKSQETFQTITITPED
jgi:hypothetical protein